MPHVGPLQRLGTAGEVSEGCPPCNKSLGQACAYSSVTSWMMEKAAGESSAVRATVGLVEKTQKQTFHLS